MAGLITAGEAVPVVEACFARMAAGAVENVPRRRLALDDGSFAVMYAVDRELGYAGVKAYTVVAGKAVFAVSLFDLRTGELAAVLEADTAGQRRTGAASGVAAKYLARRGASTLGVIGCGWQAESQVEAIRAAVPTVERVVAYCRTPERLQAFCATVGAEPAESHADAAAQDIVVTITTSRDPVLRGEWLREGALVCAVGANDPRKRGARQRRPRARELRLLRLDARRRMLESGDLIEPVEAGVLDWLEVHELQEVVAGELPGRESDADVVVFKSNGLAAWDVAIGAELVERARRARRRQRRV